MKVDINKIKEYEEYLSQVNRTDILRLEFYENDVPIHFNKEYLKEFKYRGLCNTDLILDEDFYLEALKFPNIDNEDFNIIEESI